MKLSIIIVNYNTFKMTCECIEEICKSKFDFAYEVILVDNSSTETDAENFKIKFPDIILIKNEDNNGFSRGNNLGMAIAKGEYVLLLNSDTLSFCNAIAYCVKYMDSFADTLKLGAVSCLARSLDGSMQIAANSHRYGLWSSVLDNTVAGYVVRKLGFAKYRDQDYLVKSNLVEHDAESVVGAFILCKKSVIDEIGMLDPDFFMYYEDFEFCYRMNDAGYKIRYLPQVEFVHIGQGTSANHVKLPTTLRQYALSIMLLVYKRFGVLGVHIYTIISSINIVTNSLFLKFRSGYKKEMHSIFIDGLRFAKSNKKFMLNNYTSSYGSAKEPFNIRLIEQLLESK